MHKILFRHSLGTGLSLELYKLVSYHLSLRVTPAAAKSSSGTSKASVAKFQAVNGGLSVGSQDL